MPIELPIVAPGSAGGDITSAQDGGAILRRTVLPGGVRVITEKIPGMRSATIGAWVSAGSRHEGEGQYGASHYLEHLLFKGTRKRSAQQISQVFDAAGGEANAMTGKEHTCYYARVLDDDVPLALDVICDMITDPLLDLGEFERERGVILEEISMHSDDPSDLVFENFSAALFPDHPLGRPIAGTPDEIQRIDHEALEQYYRTHYLSSTLVIAAAGGVDHDVICDQVLNALEAAKWDTSRLSTSQPRIETEIASPGLGDSHTQYRPGQQANIIVGGRGIRACDDRRFAMSIMHAIYGGGMSSRLFQRVREKHGLAYSVHSFSTGYSDSGLFGVYAGCAVENSSQVVDLIAQEWQLLARDGITNEELEQAKAQARGGLVLGLEDSSARMSRLGRAELIYGEISSVDEIIEKINGVRIEDVSQIVAYLGAQPLIRVAVGPFEDGVDQVF